MLRLLLTLVLLVAWSPAEARPDDAPWKAGEVDEDVLGPDNFATIAEAPSSLIECVGEQVADRPTPSGDPGAVATSVRITHSCDGLKDAPATCGVHEMRRFRGPGAAAPNLPPPALPPPAAR